MIQIIHVISLSFLIMIAFFVSFLDSKINTKNKRSVLIFFTCVLTIFLGVRSIGLDLEPYRLLFNNQRSISISEIFANNLFSNKLEPFFVIIISTLKEFGLGFNWFLLIAGGIPLYIIYRVIKKVEDKHMLAVFMFFLLIHFFRGPVDIIRHFFAASIYLSALYSLSKKDNMKFWVKAIPSVLVHYSNITILFIRPILGVNWNNIKFVFSFILVMIFGFIAKYFIVNFSIEDAVFINNQIFWKAHYYLTYYNVHGYQYSGIGHKILLSIITYFPLIFNITFIFLGLKNIKTIEKNEFSRLLLNSQIIGSLIAIFFIILNADTLGMRLNFLLSIGNFLLVKEIIFNCYRNGKIMLFSFTVLSLVFYNFIIILYFAGIHDPNSPFFIF